MTFQLAAGTSGYRGDTLTEITPEAAWRIANAFAGVLKGKQKDGVTPRQPQKGNRWRLALAWDTRYGAELLAHAASVGMRQAGADVLAIGTATTGVLSNFIRTHQCDGAIFVTGSHMPHTRVGIILLNADASYCTSEVTDLVTMLVHTPDALYTCELEDIGSYEDRYTHDDGTSVHGAYSHRVIEIFRSFQNTCPTLVRHLTMTGSKNLHVLIDTGNGPAGRVAGSLLRRFGFEVIELHLEERPVPERDSEVSPRACQKALAETEEQKCHLGVCFDTDADRVLFIDETGTPVEDDVAAAIFAREVVQAGDHVVTPYNNATLIERLCADVGATLHSCEIGQPDTGRVVKEVGAVFAYEASAGKHMWPKDFPYYDAVYAMMRLLEIMLRRGKKLSELVAEFPPVVRENRKVSMVGMDPDAVRRAVELACARAQTHLRELEGVAQDTARTQPSTVIAECRMFGNALRITFGDGSRFLLRASGTEPIARSYGIADTQARAASLADLGREFLQEAVR